MKLIKSISIVIIFIISGLVIASDGDVLDDNWCYEGNPWGDGRCNNEDPKIQEYNWKAGWCMAQVEDATLSENFYECMEIPEPVLTFGFTFPERDSDMSEDNCFDTCDTNKDADNGQDSDSSNDGGMSEIDWGGPNPNNGGDECVDFSEEAAHCGDIFDPGASSEDDIGDPDQ